MNWKLLKIIISNRDVKFLSKLWKIWFNKFDVQFLYFIVYHSQSDDQSKRTSQTIEIALRYHLIDIKNSKKWSQCLFTLQSQVNNFVISIEKTSNKIVYEFISILSTNLTFSKFDIMMNLTQVRKEVADNLT
jgi:hypothetical protein